MFALRSLIVMSLLTGCATSVDPVVVEVGVDAPVEASAELSTIVERSAVEIWSVDAQNGHCGGFVQSATVVVTAAHCIPEGASDVLFRRLGSNEVESAHLAHIDRAPLSDIAYLTPDRASSDYLPSRSLRDGEHATLLRPLWGTRISGIVQHVVFDDGITRQVLWGKGALGGDSGSPVVADDGEVIGIVSAGVWSARNEPLTGVTVVSAPAPPWHKPH